MGCWNHTCAITNLPIYCGEPVEVVILKESGDGSFCYSDHYHTPLPLTFSGKYNDYGAVEDCHGVAMNVLVDTIRENLIEMEEGENEFHDIPAKKAEFDVDKLFDLDHEGRLRIVNPIRHAYDKRESIALNHVVIRKNVYDGLIEGMTFERYDRETSKSYTIGYDRIRADIEHIKADIDEIVALPGDDFRRMSLIRTESITNKTFAGRMLAHHSEGSYAMNAPLNVIDLLFDLREDGDENFDAMIDNALRLSMLISFMNGSRRSWNVPSGCGSQSDNTSYQELCANLTLSEAEKIQHHWDE